MDSTTDTVSNETVAGSSMADVQKKEQKEGLHTYATDFGASISGERGDIIRRAIKEEEAKQAAQKSQTLASRKNLLMFAGSILCIIAGIAAIVYFAFSSKTKTVNPVQNKVPSIVFADTSVEIPLTGLSKEQTIAKITAVLSEPIPAGTISYIFFTDVRDTVKYLVGAKSLLTVLGSKAPELLTDRIGTTFMFGKYGGTSGVIPFIVLKTDAYNEAFDGMRAWESRLFDDFYLPFAITTRGDNSNLFEAKFQDSILKNKSARVLKNSAGTISLLYSFVDDATIVITTNPEALDEIATRLAAQKVQQL